VKDGPAFLDLMRSSYSDPAFEALMNKSTAESGLKVSMKTEDKKEGEFSYRQMKILLSVTDPSKFASGVIDLDAKSMKAIFDELSNKISIYLASTRNKVYMTMGDEGLSDLTALAKADAHPEDMSKDSAYAAFAKLAGDDGQILMRVSTNKLLSLITTAVSSMSGSPESFSMPEEANSGLWSQVRAQGNTLQSVGFWSTKEIAVVVQQAMSLYMSSLFGGQAFDTEGGSEDFEFAEDLEASSD
jgi:hypothetical protein